MTNFYIGGGGGMTPLSFPDPLLSCYHIFRFYVKTRTTSMCTEPHISTKTHLRLIRSK